MFEYAKKDLQKKLQNLENKHEKTALEIKEIEEKKIKLENYLTLMSNFIDSNILLVLSFAAFCMSLLVAAEVGLSILFAVISIVQGGLIVENRKIIKKNYSEFLPEKKIFDLKKQLKEQEAVINEKKDKILIKIEEYKKELEQVTQLEETNDLCNVPQNPYYLADTDKDYDRLSTAKKNGVDKLFNVYLDCLLDNYLEEKINPASVHYDNKMGDNIQYTESSKKLIKKK